MSDFSWLATEAKTIHLIFQNLFYSLLAFLICVGVFLEYFKIPIGGLPSTVPLIGRAFIAAIMLVSFPEFLNLVGDVTDSLSQQIGHLNEFKHVLEKMGDQLETLTWSWTSVKQMTIVVISFLTFFILYISVYVSEAIYFYAWTLLYIFSPLCFALFVIPQTQGAAKGVYASILKVASWKIIWSVLATLLWSAALIDLNKLGTGVDFLTLILFNLMLAGSLLFTPVISNRLSGGQFAEAAAKIGGAASGGVLYGFSKITASAPVKSLNQYIKSVPQKSIERLNFNQKSLEQTPGSNKRSPTNSNSVAKSRNSNKKPKKGENV